MKMIPPLLILALLAPAAPTVAGTMPQRRFEQDEALAARKQGHILPLREIERRVTPTVKGAQYIGFSFESATAVYTLKFLRDGKVIWVMVDARSGAVLGRAGG